MNQSPAARARRGILLLGALLASAAARAGEAEAPHPGAALYAARCASCHDHPVGRIPPRGYLAVLRAPEDVVAALESGLMQAQGAGLDRAQREAVAEYLTGKRLGEVDATRIDPAANRCSGRPAPFGLEGPQWNGWGRDVANTRYNPDPGLAVADIPRLKPKWAFALPGGIAWGQAVVVGGRVFAVSRGGNVVALDARRGCTLWVRELGVPVRGAPSVGALPAGAPARFALLFAEHQRGVVHALDAETGRPLWRTVVEDHPAAHLTAAPTLHAGRLYVPVSSMEEVSAGMSDAYACCSFRGSIVALDSASGRIVWKAHAIEDEPRPTRINSAGVQMRGPAGAAIWATPTIDAERGLLYAATGNSYTEVETEASDAIVAFDLATGARRWVSQVLQGDNSLVNCTGRTSGNCPQPEGPNLDFGSSPVLRTLADGRRVIALGSESGIAYGFDAERAGRAIWRRELGDPPGEGSILHGQAADADTLYVANFQRAPVEENIEKGHVFRPLPKGALSALDLATGALRWRVPAPAVACAWGTENCSNGQRAAVTAIPGAVFSGTLDGRIRAYAAADGKVLWEFDAGRPFAAVNGVQAGGGPITEGGQTIAGGMLYLNVSSAGGGPAALVAFSVDGD